MISDLKHKHSVIPDKLQVLGNDWVGDTYPMPIEYGYATYCTTNTTHKYG